MGSYFSSEPSCSDKQNVYEKRKTYALYSLLLSFFFILLIGFVFIEGRNPANNIYYASTPKGI